MPHKTVFAIRESHLSRLCHKASCVYQGELGERPPTWMLQMKKMIISPVGAARVVCLSCHSILFFHLCVARDTKSDSSEVCPWLDLSQNNSVGTLSTTLRLASQQAGDQFVIHCCEKISTFCDQKTTLLQFSQLFYKKK